MSGKKTLIVILLLASLIRLYGLGRGDTVNDEVFYAFRAIGMLDFDEGKFQTTPLQWFDPMAHPKKTQIPWWTHLSFHDHPPLIFLIQHIFIKLLGENNIAFRLPSAIAGVLSVYLLYLIGSRLFSPQVAVISSLLLSVTLNHVYISRTGLQESYVIFLSLLASYFFIRSLQKDSYLIWTGVALGFGFLAKYNLFIFVPVFLTYLAFYKRAYLYSRKFLLAIAIALVLFSPVIVYNIKLYRSVGHFDFQFSYIFGQNHPEWQVQPGKEIGLISERIRHFIPRLVASNSWLFLLLVAASFFVFLMLLTRHPQAALQKYSFLIITLVYLAFLIVLVGPAYRFLTILTPFFALSVGVFCSAVYTYFQKKSVKMFMGIGFVVILLFELVYSVNNEIMYYPGGSVPWLSSKVRYENYNWGYNNLDDFLNRELAGKMPLLTFDVQYQFLETLRLRALSDELKMGLERYPFLIVYGGNFDDGAKLWVMERRIIYHAWPVLRADDYFNYLEKEGSDYFERVGFKHQYFIWQTNMISPEWFRKRIGKTPPIVIKNQRGDASFEVYKIDL